MAAKPLAMSAGSGVASLTVTGTCGLWAMNVALSAVQFCAAAPSCTNGPLAEEKKTYFCIVTVQKRVA